MKKYAEPKTLDARGRTLFYLALLEKESRENVKNQN